MTNEDATILEALLRRARNANERSVINRHFKNADYWRIMMGRPLSKEEERIASNLGISE